MQTNRSSPPPITSAAPSKKQSQRKARTRQALLTAGKELFSQRPIDSVTIDEIVDTAGVAKGSFYNYFNDKEALAAAIIDMVREDCEFQIYKANRNIDDPATRIVRALSVMIRYGIEHRERLQALLSLEGDRTSVSAPLNSGVVRDVREGLASGLLCGISVEGAVLVVIGIINVTVLHTVRHPDVGELRMRATEVGSALLKSLGLSTSDADSRSRAAADDLLSMVVMP